MRKSLLLVAMMLLAASLDSHAASHPEQNTSGKQTQGAERETYQWRDLYAPTNIPNWCLALVGIWAGGMAYRTLRTIEKQTDQLKVQADLMREQMDRGVQRERARLSLSVQPIRISEDVPNAFIRLFSCMELTNTGHSNAYIRFGAARFAVVPSGELLPEVDPDELPFGANTIEPAESPVYAGFWGEDFPFTMEGFTQGLADSTLRIRLYGFIEYETMGIMWHRDFGYIWTIEDSIDDPPNLVFRSLRNKEEICVSGQWEQDVSQKNGEYQVSPKAN
jgi:hypothetical protein